MPILFLPAPLERCTDYSYVIGTVNSCFQTHNNGDVCPVLKRVSIRRVSQAYCAVLCKYCIDLTLV